MSKWQVMCCLFHFYDRFMNRSSEYSPTFSLLLGQWSCSNMTINYTWSLFDRNQLFFLSPCCCICHKLQDVQSPLHVCSCSWSVAAINGLSVSFSLESLVQHQCTLLSVFPLRISWRWTNTTLTLHGLPGNSHSVASGKWQLVKLFLTKFVLFSLLFPTLNVRVHIYFF